MPSLLVPAFGSATVTVPAAASVSVWTLGTAKVYQTGNYPQHVQTKSLLGTVAANVTVPVVFGPYASGATLVIESQNQPVYYEIGTASQVQYALPSAGYQPTPIALNATGALTAAMILAGIVTSTTAAAVTGTLPTGTVLDAASTFAIGDSVDWSVINTGATNAFTVAAATGHTIVGSAAVALSASGHFRTQKTAANTFVTYRLS
jgi:hypothetical protein